MKNYFNPKPMLSFFSACCFSLVTVAQGTLINNFGSNPGNINAYQYVPSGIPSNAPLVVVIHGCTQNASGFSNQTKWNTLADSHKFYVVYAEQKSANNSNSCFNYWEPGDHNRGGGEALSIKQAVDYMKANYSIDNGRVFVTGLSAGGAMTAVMCCAYPDVFAAGASMAGLPYKVATGSTGVYLAALGQVSKTPQQWGDLARVQNPGYTGSWPRMSLFHGTSDAVINDNNSNELMKQFTNLHGTDQTADRTVNSFNGVSSVQLKQYRDGSGKVVVEHYIISGMGHGIAVDPGSCFQQGGVAGTNSYDADIFSSYWAAYFFGILQMPYNISGAIQVTQNQQGVVYTVPNNTGSTFQWQVPSGATIVSGQGNNSITVNWGSSGGTVSVTETQSNNCKVGPVELSVTITGCPNTDCNGVCGGAAVVDDCGICSGGTTGNVANSAKDCEGVCFGNATLDCNGVCNGNTQFDCTGICGGSAIIDTCGICLQPSDPGFNICNVTSVLNIIEKEIKIYPNPFSKMLNVCMEKYENSRIEIFSPDGRKIFEDDMKNRCTGINSWTWNSGIYFIRISADAQTIFFTKMVNE
jgi:poly(hydroxyalkanoate) depolymerase family esterase